MNCTTQYKETKNVYDDDDIPPVDLPKGNDQAEPAKPLPKSTPPEKNGQNSEGEA